MAGSNRRWNQCLFPIDDSLIERLIEDYSGSGEEDDALAADDPFETEADGEFRQTWYLVEESEEALLEAAGPATADDEHAVNMRVLDDYLRRRMIDEPEPIAHTLH